jgi:hypothetical protein
MAFVCKQEPARKHFFPAMHMIYGVRSLHAAPSQQKQKSMFGVINAFWVRFSMIAFIQIA